MVITLKRTPERLEQFIENNAHQGLDIETLEAVDGLSLDREQLVRDGLMSADIDWGAGALGAALSHRLCWLRAVETGRPVGIFEDDVLLRRDFTRQVEQAVGDLPEDWDIIHFGINTDSVLEVELVPGRNVSGGFDRQYPTEADCVRFVNAESAVTPVRLITGFGTCAYVVSPKGARILLENCFPLRWTMYFVRRLDFVLKAYSGDAVMNAYYSQMSVFLCWPPIAIVRNDKALSTVNA